MAAVAERVGERQKGRTSQKEPGEFRRRGDDQPDSFAAEQGATPHQLMAIFGWKSLKQAELYTRAANEKKLAALAMHMLEPDRTENESVPPEKAVASGGTMKGKKSL